jgi:hypothetical protein
MSADSARPARPRKDWCRNAEWTAPARERFFLRLSSLPNPARYLRRKAQYLADTEPAAALELLDMAVTQASRPAECISARREQARLLLRLGRHADADAAWRDALARCGQGPMRIQTGLDHALFMALQADGSGHAQSRALLDSLDEQLLAAPQRFVWHAARALLADARGDTQSAMLDARSAFNTHRLYATTPQRLPELGEDATLSTGLYHRLFALAGQTLDTGNVTGVTPHA